MKMKKLLALLLALCMVLALAACTDSTNGDSENTNNAKDQLENQENQGNLENLDEDANSYIRDQLTLAWNTASSLTCWGTNNDIPGNYEVYEMLYEVSSDGELYPLLADASYDGNFMPGCDHEDGSGVYTVKIYDYIHDHNGTPVTAEDVAFSFMYQYENETTSDWGDLVSVEAEDDTTVVFTFTEDQDGLGQLSNILCRCFIVSEKSFTESASGLVNEMCGTGPYKFVSYTSGSELVLERYEDYWQKDELRRQEQQANVQKIVYKFIDEAAQRSVALKTGTVDFVHELPADNALDFADGGEYADQYNVYSYAAKFVYYLTPNCSEQSVCGDINMRLAILNAIDQDGLVTALGGTNTRLNAYVTDYYNDYGMVAWDSLDNYNTRSSVDTALVKQYLDAAGYNNEQIVIVETGVDDAAQIVAAQLQACGINATVQTLDFSSYQARIADSSAWDLDLGMMAGDYNVQVWAHAFSYGNTGDGDHTSSYVVDQEWEDLLNLVNTEDGHTSENMQAWWQHAVDNAYTMGLYSSIIYDIIPEDTTYVCLGDKLTVLPGGFTFADPNA